MPINFFQLQELSKKISLSLENTEKELFHNFLFYLLFSISKMKKYTNFLAFKGGTCLYKCYGLPRFSEDLDFDILQGKLNKKDIDALFNKHLANVLRDTFGFANIYFIIKKSPTGFTIHTNVRGPAYSQIHRDCHIKFDLSSRKRLLYKSKQVNYNASIFLTYYKIQGFISLKTMDPREIFAEKILAILDKNFIFGQRDEARDLFDLYFLLLKNYSCKYEDIQKKLISDKKNIFTLKNFSDSIYNTVKSREWNMMIEQLIIKSKLNDLSLNLDDLEFNKISKFVLDRFRSLYGNKDDFL